MIKMVIIVVCIVLIICGLDNSTFAAQRDSLRVELPSGSKASWDPYTFKFKQIAIPLTLIAAASTTLFLYDANDIDNYVQSAIYNSNSFKHDDWFQYMPIATMWALDAFGVKSQHRFAEQTTTLALASIFMATMVNTAKYTIKRQRPNSGSFNSFPSGHTATAFMAAEFLRMEYRNTSPWIGISGYCFALATGYLRVHNGRHYPGDVLAGAGVGILSVKMAYWLSPVVNRWIWGSDVRALHEGRRARKIVSPYTTGSEYGLSLYASF